MPRVSTLPRNSVNDRPVGLASALRRQRWLLRPAAWLVPASLRCGCSCRLLHAAGRTPHPAASLTSIARTARRA